jgi:hypothetical protein
MGGYIQQLADGGSVGTGDPHLDKVLDEVMSHMIGSHPDPEGSAMHYLDLLMPGSTEGYQHSGQYPAMAKGGGVDDATGGGNPDEGAAGIDMDDMTGGDDGGAHEGILSGADGGMDDSVQAQSDDGSPVALSHGEYVVPADVVAMLGDGNTDAGAQMLDQFIQSVRQMKYGNNGEQPQQTPDDVFSSLMGQGGDPSQGGDQGGPPPGPPPGAGPMPGGPPPQEQQPPPGMWDGGSVTGLGQGIR